LHVVLFPFYVEPHTVKGSNAKLRKLRKPFLSP